MVLDTETATMPFANDICRNTEEKKKIAIAKPLVYDIGWTITDRMGNIEDEKQFLVAETFCVPSIFNTAYYAEKRPIYLETKILPWNDIMAIFISDLHSVNAIGCFNSMFDLKKALPFTDLYISKLYSPNYYKWEDSPHTNNFVIKNYDLPEGTSFDVKVTAFDYFDNPSLNNLITQYLFFY